MDSTYKSFKKFPKFPFANTECQSLIIIGVFKEYCDEKILKDLKTVSFISILLDASNHKEIKLIIIEFAINILRNNAPTSLN